MKAPSDVYPTLLRLVKDKDYFVLTTNVDHQFQLAGEAYCPDAIKTRSLCIDGDIKAVLSSL